MKDRYRTIENLNPSFLVQVNADNVLDEIRNNAHQTSLLSRLLVLCGLLFTVSLYLILPPTSREHVLVAQAFGLLGLLVLVGLPWANQKDEKRLTTNITYQFDEMGEQVVEAIKRLVQALMNVDRIWSVTTEHSHGHWKYNAGAETSINRQQVNIGWGCPPRVLTNVSVGKLVIGKNTLFLFPDRILVYGSGGTISSIGYTEVGFFPGETNFIETETLPRDCSRVGSSWLYVNKDGSPDRRFNNNRQLPVVKYSVLEMESLSGLKLHLLMSSLTFAEQAVHLLNTVKAAIRIGESYPKRDKPFLHNIIETKDQQLHTSSGKTNHAIEVFLRLLDFRWISKLPDWASPMIWGILIALPAVPTLFIFRSGINWVSGSTFTLTIALFSCTVFALLRPAEPHGNEEEVEFEEDEDESED